MKKIILLATIAASAMFVTNCKTIDKAQVSGGKEAIIVTYLPRINPFGMFNATAEDCLDELAKEGATRVVNFSGQSRNSAFRPMTASISNYETCKAVGVK